MVRKRKDFSREKILRLGSAYFKFIPTDQEIEVGEWDMSSIAYLNLRQMVFLRQFLDQKIMEIHVENLKEKSPF